MNKVKQIFQNTARRVVDWVAGNGLMQEENTAEGERYVTEGMPELIRACGEEGIVLLKNDGTLPLKKEEKVAVFGRVQMDWFYVGYGSGGDVHPPYSISLHEGLRNQNIQVDEKLKGIYETWCKNPDNAADHGWWGHWPYFHPEMPLDDAVVKEAAKENDVALVVIGRAAGEDRENVLKPGSYYLTDLEKKMLSQVCGEFSKVVLVMNCGNIMDCSFFEEYNFSAVLYAWQLGQESGNAVASVLSGAVNPSGKLSDTIAKTYEDYPSAPYFGKKEYNEYTEDIYIGYRYFTTFKKDRVQFPFGYGLSYTTFDIETVDFLREEGKTSLRVKVTNTGEVAGKEVVQVYCKQPLGKLSKSERILAAFAKTKLLEPKESQELLLQVEDSLIASFDDKGVTGFASAFVLEAGKYEFVVGSSVLAELSAGIFEIEETIRIEQCEAACVVDKNGRFQVMTNQGMETVYSSECDLKEKILERLPEEIPYKGNQNISLFDVKCGKHSLEEFISQLSDKELGDLTHGEGGMGSMLGIVGNAGAFGGINEELRGYGIPALITADGPAGLRIKKFTSLLPCGTAIACTWNTELVERLFTKEGEEVCHFGVDVILSPGMNLHRNPLCGRNFEYYSEDPVLSGKMAAAAVRGIQKGGASACPKHFACNTQEVNRNYNDSRLSERALREVYLRNFEICVKEGKPQNLMTSYNKINGVWSHYSYDLVTTILRKEWGYEGNVLTDWWMRKAKSPEFPSVKDNAYRTRAQVDVLMPGNMLQVQKAYKFDKQQLKTLGKREGLTRGELQRTAKNVLTFAMTRMK